MPTNRSKTPHLKQKICVKKKTLDSVVARQRKKKKEERRRWLGLVLQHPRPAWIWLATETHSQVLSAVGLLKPSGKGGGRRVEGRSEDPREEMADKSDVDLW